MRAKQKIIELLTKDSLAYKGLDNLFYFINKTYSIPLEEIKQDFEKLKREGLIFDVRNGKYISSSSTGYSRGVFQGTAKGYGFVVVPEREEDIFIPANMTNGAIDGDKVIVKTISKTTDGTDGQIVSVYDPIEYLAGNVEKVGRNFFLEPDNNHIPFKIRLQTSGVKFDIDDKVSIKLIRSKDGIIGQVVEVFGKSDDVKACEQAIIRDYQLFEIFPKDVIDEAEKLPKKILPSQKQGRVDLTNKVIFTIDGEDAKDLDDAVSIEKTADGFVLGVHIADVGQYVKYETRLDEEAFKRGTSVYFPTSVLPMLPKQLSNGICSLNENEERLTLTCQMNIDKDGFVRSHKIYESVIKSKARLNYTEVYKVLCGKKADAKTESVKEELLLMHELSKIIQKKNKINGSLDFDIPEVQFVFDDEGRAVDFEKRERNDAHRLIEDFMVIANQTVAKEFCDKDIPFVYRVHESPQREKVLATIDYLKGLGIKVPYLPSDITPKFYQELIKLVEDKTYTESVNKVILRSMQKAKYSNECLGHFGLALEYYCHFTSPIRRYPDLTIHRIIKECLHKGKLSGKRIDELDTFTYESSMQSSQTERNAEKAERDVDDLWKAYLMKDRVGQEFEGVISSVTNFGVFVELENTVEGLIRIEDLPDEGFLLFERQQKLKGQHISFGVGDKIRVKLLSANIFTRKVDFSFVEFVR